jgi:DNA-binding MarR family transcriptional regulator
LEADITAMAKLRSSAIQRPATRAAAPPDDLPLERYITFGLLRLTNRLNRQSMRLVEENGGLKLPEWRCLAFIGRVGRISLNEIAELTSMDRALISRSVQSLVERGLVLVERDTVDRRIVNVAVTAGGRATHARLRPVMEARQRRLLAALGDEDRAALDRILGRLNHCLDGWPDKETSP